MLLYKYFFLIVHISLKSLFSDFVKFQICILLQVITTETIKSALTIST